MIHLDTNLLIALLDPTHPHAPFVEKLVHSGEPLGCSSLAWMELHSKPIPARSLILLKEILSEGIAPFSEEIAEKSGEWFQRAGGQRKLRFDCCIAATAHNHNALLATANTPDFLPFTKWGLQLKAI